VLSPETPGLPFPLYTASGEGAAVVVLDSDDPPRSISLRVAGAFAGAETAAVFVCHWRQVALAEAGVVVRPPLIRICTTGQIVAIRDGPPIPASVLFFFAPESGFVPHADLDALRALQRSDIVGDTRLVCDVVDQIMLAAARRGVVTNALGDAVRWGRKGQQEAEIRLYEHHTRRAVPRPETVCASRETVSRVVASFSARGLTAIVKPNLGGGGQGIAIIGPGDRVRLPDASEHWVVQRLLSDPLLVGNHKVDLRCFLLLDLDERSRSRGLNLMLVRAAPAPYRPAQLLSELTNTAIRTSYGLAPAVWPLACVPEIAAPLREEIAARVAVLLDELVLTYFWHDGGRCVPRVENRVLLFGVDVLIAGQSGERLPYFLEVNPLPALFRGAGCADRAVETMLRHEYLPAMLARAWFAAHQRGSASHRLD
jgi:hypothetical protein